jgi:two-component system CheB/CheR fusion protein
MPKKKSKLRGNSASRSSRPAAPKRPVRPQAAAKPAPAAAAAPPEERDASVTVVGIGASAGGLEAASQLLRALPADSQLALVLVQHMSPSHDSMLAQLLSGITHLQVTELADDTTIEPGHVYVAPPNRTVELANSRLRLHTRPTDRSQYTPIDTFFGSLAEELQQKSIGVILSGTASDGTEGVHAIKAVGGTVLVQTPETAKQEGMPTAAINTGKVDWILSPGEIADELVRISHRRPRHSIQPRRAGDSLSLQPHDLERIFAMLRSSTGVDFGLYKLPTLQRRIQRRMALHRILTTEHYVKFLEENPAELQQLYQDVLIHVTGFFREPESFEVLANAVFPSILEARQGDVPVRVWIPACSTGEEPYSVAMTLTKCLEQRAENVPIQIFATDVSDSAIEHARSGIYSGAAIDDLSPDQLRRFFTRADGQFRINKAIRDLCVFARQDLTRDPPFSKLDLIMCRNVLIYLGQSVQNRLINVFHYALKSTGFLILGTAETIGPHADLFAVADRKHRVYRKKVVETPTEVYFSLPHSRLATGRGLRGVEALPGAGSVQGEANRVVLDRYAPPGVIVNEDLRIIQFRGQTGRYLEPAPGDASLNLLKMCREGLLLGLRTAIQNAKKRDAAVRRDGLRVKTNGEFIAMAVEVVPLTMTGQERHYLVLFLETPAAEPESEAKPSSRKLKSPSKGAITPPAEIDRLQKELVASREYQQSIIQDLEAANEELQSANEEILSSNEELQSTNEELDTAKEELQSTNEELNTVNEELSGRNEELARINSDLVNLLNGVQMAIVIVANDLRIRRFTPVAERVLNLIPGDIGRPISQIKPNINCPDLEQLITEVIDTMSVQHREVQDLQGRSFSLTIRPYKNVDNRIDGAVLALYDVDEMRRHEQDANHARAISEIVLNASPDPMVILDGDLRVRNMNLAFCAAFKTQKADAEQRLFFEMAGGAWNHGELRTRLESLQGGDAHFEPVELHANLPGLSVKHVRVQGWSSGGSEKQAGWILLTVKEL